MGGHEVYRDDARGLGPGVVLVAGVEEEEVAAEFGGREGELEGFNELDEGEGELVIGDFYVAVEVAGEAGLAGAPGLIGLVGR